MTGVFVRVLGEVSLSRDGAEVRLPPKPRLLLALLVATRRGGVSNDEVLDVLYDGKPPPTADSALRVHVAKLRDALEPGRERAASSRVAHAHERWRLRLETQESDVGLLEASVAEADALQSSQVSQRVALGAQALASAGAIPYPDLQGPVFEAERVRLQQLVLSAGRSHAAVLLDAGDAGTAHVLLDTLLHAEPYDEGLAALRARAAYQESGTDNALRVVREFREWLAEELGLDSSPVLDAAEAALLRHDRSLAPRTARATTGTAGRLIGRHAELERVGRILEDGGSVSVSGPVGIGKTSLLRALADSPGTLLVSAAGGAPYSLVCDLLAAGPHPPEDESGWRRLRAVALGHADQGQPKELPLLADDLCRTHLAQNAVVLVDDAEAPDEPSMEVLSRLFASRVQLVVARRPAEPLAPDPWESGQLHLLTMQPLDRESTVQLAARVNPGATPPDDLWERTGGVPLLIELAAQGEESAAIAPRLLGQLGAEAVQLARRLALLGRPVPAATIEGLSGPEALTELLVSTVAAEQGGLLGIKHPLIRESIVAGMDPSDRSGLITGLLGSGLPPLALTTAVLDHGATLPRAAVETWALAAGPDALASGDAARAVRIFELATGSEDDAVRAAAEHGRARGYLALGHVAAARSDLVGVMERLRRLGDDLGLAEAIGEYVGMFAPQSAEVVVVERHARWLLARPALDADRRVAVLSLLAATATFGDLEGHTTALLEECERAGTTGSALAGIAAQWRLSYHHGRPAAERLRLSRSGLELARELRDTSRHVQFLRHHIDDLMASCRLADAEAAAAELDHLARTGYDAYGRWWVDLLGVEKVLRSGDPAAGLAAAGERHARWPRMPLDLRDSNFQQQAFVALYQLGERAQLQAGLVEVQASGELDDIPDLLVDACLLMLRAEDGEADAEAVEAFVADVASAPPRWRRPAELFLAGRAAVAAGRVPDGLIELVTTYAEEWVLIGTAAATLGPMSSVLADLHALEGDVQMALTWHSRATESCAAMEAHWWADQVAHPRTGRYA